MFAENTVKATVNVSKMYSKTTINVQRKYIAKNFYDSRKPGENSSLW